MPESEQPERQTDLRIFGIPIVENQEMDTVLGKPGNVSLGKLTNSVAAQHVFKRAIAPRTVGTIPAVFEIGGR